MYLLKEKERSKLKISRRMMGYMVKTANKAFKDSLKWAIVVDHVKELLSKYCYHDMQLGACSVKLYFSLYTLSDDDNYDTCWDNFHPAITPINEPPDSNLYAGFNSFGALKAMDAYSAKLNSILFSLLIYNDIYVEFSRNDEMKHYEWIHIDRYDYTFYNGMIYEPEFIGNMTVDVMQDKYNESYSNEIKDMMKMLYGICFI